MGAVLQIDDFPQPNKKFKVPLRTEVAKYIEDKMKWPQEFCLFYADKFWDHYNSQGWKLANGNQMKDWRSAFNSNWQNPRFEADQKYLVECKKKADPMRIVEYLDTILRAYGRDLKPDRESAIKIYDWLKQNGLAKLSKEEIEWIKDKCGDDIIASKLWSVKFIFDKMVKNNLTFSDIWKR